MQTRRRVLLKNTDTRVIPITWDAGSNNKYIGADGKIGTSNLFHYSNPLRVTVGDYVYRFVCTANIGKQTRIHGYNASGEWVRQLAHMSTGAGTYEISFSVSDGIRFVKISNGTAGVSNETLTKVTEGS